MHERAHIQTHTAVETHQSENSHSLSKSQAGYQIAFLVGFISSLVETNYLVKTLLLPWTLHICLVLAAPQSDFHRSEITLAVQGSRCQRNYLWSVRPFGDIDDNVDVTEALIMERQAVQRRILDNPAHHSRV